MKKSLIIGLLAVTGMSLTSCDHLLNENRFPLDQETNNPSYWDNKNNVEMQLNMFLSNFAGYGNGAGRNSTFYFTSLSDDQCYSYGSDIQFTKWKFEQVPTTNSTWSASYIEIRRANYIIENIENSTHPAAVKGNYIGIARLNRAIQYYELVRAFGDVPLVETVLNTDSEELYGPRNNRNDVMDFVLADLNYAVANITTQKSLTDFSKDMANAVKAKICLFEGAFAKYHQNDNARAQKYFNEVVNACNTLMDGRYTLCADYQSLYNSMPSSSSSMPSNPEAIMMKYYTTGKLGHSLVKYLSTTVPIMGMTKDAFDSYLFKDGKPLSSTTLDKNDAGVMVGEGDDAHCDLSAVLATRDDRLAKTLDDFICFGGFEWKRNNSDWLSSLTGYAIKKYINPNMTFQIATYDGANDTNAPLFWLAEIYLAFAEAKAELGTITDGDLNNSINKLYARAGLPAQTVASLTNMGDNANNMNVPSLIWEIRRCRRCELMFDNDTRYWDLIRWKQLEILDTNNYPNTALGANVSNIPENLKKNIFTNAAGYIDCAQTANGRFERKFNQREYLYPLGSGQLDLNPQLTQNPGW